MNAQTTPLTLTQQIAEGDALYRMVYGDMLELDALLADGDNIDLAIEHDKQFDGGYQDAFFSLYAELTPAGKAAFRENLHYCESHIAWCIEYLWA